MYSKILVPVDGSETSAAGLNEAIKLAKIHGSQLCLIHIVNEFVLDYTYVPGHYSQDLVESLRKAGQEILDDAESTVQRQGIKPKCVLVESIGGAAADLILEQAKDWRADLIVMGTHGRRGIFRLAMGSDAEQVVRASNVPVLLIRGQAVSKKTAQRVPEASAA
jgi:nucleotide-binding universal stress UspA family protein